MLGKPKPKRPYSEDDQATALAIVKSNNGNVKRTARECGIPTETLRRWVRGGGISRDVPAKSAAKQADLASIFERVSRLYLENAARPATVRKTRGKDSVIAACAAVDKVRLLRGESTSIHAQSGGGAAQISVLVVPAATDPNGRTYSPAEVAELSVGLGSRLQNDADSAELGPGE
jgi:transposase-like protein